MKILQLTSDWKWTGPAEPMLRLAAAQRAHGHSVALAYPSAPIGTSRSLASEAEAAGFASALLLDRRRGVHPFGDRKDTARLRAWLCEHSIDVVHCWHTRDHVLAWRALRGGRGSTAIVRSYRIAERIAHTPWNRWLFGPATDALLCASPETARRNASLRGARPIAGMFGAVELQRYQPRPSDPDVRRSLGFAPEHEVIGIVARMQRHRRFDLLLAAAQQLFARRPNARLLIVGRGTNREEVAERPAAALGIADRVAFAGYRAGDYADVLRSIDVFTFLVPGSDGSCRALLEAAACGIPAVTTRRGALAEIVVDGETGLLVDETPASLAAAWEALLADPTRRAAMGSAASRRAAICFAPERFAGIALQLYEEALATRTKRP